MLFFKAHGKCDHAAFQLYKYVIFSTIFVWFFLCKNENRRAQYTIWTLLWIGWNIFLICFYLNVGVLNRVSTWNGSIKNENTSDSTFWYLQQPKCQNNEFESETILLTFGSLNFQDSDMLNLGTGSISWFEVNGYGCVPTYPTNITSEDPYRMVRPEFVEGCFLEYFTIEVIHSAVQLCFAVIFRFFFSVLCS